MSDSALYKVRGVTFGEGRPKICLPLVSADLAALRRDVQDLLALPFDLAEWRVDCFAAFRDETAVREALGLLRRTLGDKPLLFTFRSLPEGGQAELSPEDYRALNLLAAGSGLVDLVDVELFQLDKAPLAGLVDELHRRQVGVVISSHDFARTPSKDAMVYRLQLARRLGADLPKLDVMPRQPEDVLALLEATVEANRLGCGPLITMSMGALGGVSRLAGETFGSAMTFGCAGQASAPGQYPAGELCSILDSLHRHQ